MSEPLLSGKIDLSLREVDQRMKEEDKVKDEFEKRNMYLDYNEDGEVVFCFYICGNNFGRGIKITVDVDDEGYWEWNNDYVESEVSSINYRYRENTITSLYRTFFEKQCLKEVKFGDGWEEYNEIESMQSMFDGCTELETIEGLEKVEFFNVKDTSHMFNNCYSLDIKSEWFDNIDTAKVEDMSFMFANCWKLKDISLHFDTSSVENMKGLFWTCKNLKTVDINSFDTTYVTNMMGMFEYCSSIKNIDLSKWKTPVLEDISNMFWNCTILKSVKLNNFNTKKVVGVKMYDTFIEDTKAIEVSYKKDNWNKEIVSYYKRVSWKAV